MKFVILAQPRSGSTLLMQLLDSHPDIRCEGELLEFKVDSWMDVSNPLLREVMKRPPVKTYLRRMPRRYLDLRARRAGAPLWGFKVFLSHLGWPGRVLSDLHGHGWKIIRLVRGNVLNQALSMRVAHATGHYHRRDPGDGPGTGGLSIDPAEVTTEIQRRIQIQEQELGLLNGLDHEVVYYEQDLLSEDRREATLARLLEHIGAAPATLSAGLSRTYDRGYDEIVQNHAEIVAAALKMGLPLELSAD